MSLQHAPGAQPADPVVRVAGRGRLPLVAVVGPTACGKTRRAVSLAHALNAEIISGDSRQVYTGMDIGTGKDMGEYGSVPVHLIDIRPAGYRYNLHEYLCDYAAAEDDIRSRGKNVILCGGTGMYVEAVLSGMRLPHVPENKELRRSLQGRSLSELATMLQGMKTLHNVTDTDTCARAVRAIEIQEYYSRHPTEAVFADRQAVVRPEAVIILVDIDRDNRRQRISSRLDARLKEGLEMEVRTLLDSGLSPEDLEYYGLEYKFVTQAVTGKITRQEMHRKLETAIHQFAKRQMTWYRGMERRGFTLHPIPWNLSDQEFLSAAMDLIKAKLPQ